MTDASGRPARPPHDPTSRATASQPGRWSARLAGLEARPAHVIFGIGALMLAAYVASLGLLRKPDGRIVMGDAVHYYVYVRSVVYDGDLAFRNEYVRLYGLRGGEPGTEWVYEPTATGLTRNMMAIGTPLAWSPLFVVTSAAAWVAGLFGLTYRLDGYGRLFQATAGISGLLCGVLGAWLAYRLAGLFVNPRIALWSTLVIWLGSNAVYYTFISPTYSHAVSMLALGGLFLCWATTVQRQTPARYALLGVFVGLTALVRWQDAVFLIVPVADAGWTVWAHGRTGAAGARARAWRNALANLAACGAAALVTFSPQVLVWMTLYAQPVAMPQGAGWMEWHAPHLAKVLFSDWHGLLTWSPVIALSLVGFWPLARRHPRAAVVMGAALLASWYGNGSVVEWWAGEAYGARRFVSCFPIFVVAAAVALDWWGPRLTWLAALTTAIVAHNVLLLLQYQLFMHGMRTVAPYPKGAYGMWLARFVVPFDLVRWWLAEG